MKILHINVLDKIATYRYRDGEIVCGNSDYRVQFTFDDEWTGLADKTARFIWNGQYFDVPLDDTNACDVPVIVNAYEVKVGVYAGDLSTTTSAKINCKKSILCGGEAPNPGYGGNYTTEAQQAAEAAKASRDEAVLAATSAQKTLKAVEEAVEGMDAFTEEASASAQRAEQAASDAAAHVLASAENQESASQAANTAINSAYKTEKIAESLDFVTPEMFGAVGNGNSKEDAVDDTNALKAAIASGKSVCLTKYYLVTEPIILPANTHIFGGGTIIKKDNTKATISNNSGSTKSVNAIFILTGAYITIENCFLSGSVDNGVTGIAFGNNAIMFRISKVRIVGCYNGLTDVFMCFMGAFENVHCQSCENGFALKNVDKTSLTFKNCWCENCGQAYDFKSMTYSTLQNCGADYCNYENQESGYGKGYGSNTSNKGTYYFELCKNVSMVNCGAETSYGTCVVDLNACIITIDGLTVHNFKGNYNPSTVEYGVIKANQERSIISARNIYVTGFSNEPYTDSGKKLGIIAYNYSSSAYGDHDGVDVTLDCYSVDSKLNLAVFVGVGNYSRYCTDLTMLRDSPVIKNLLTVGSFKIRATKTLTGNGNTIVIPFKSQVNDWKNHLFTLVGFSNAYNDQQPKAFSVTIALSALNSLKNPAIVQKSNEKITFTTDGMNLRLVLPDTYTSIRLDCTENTASSLMNWDDVSLSSTTITE